MPSGRVKNFNTERGKGLIVADETGRDYVVKAEDVEGGTLRSGDVVEFESQESEASKRRENAVSVTIVKAAPEYNPVGRVIHAPPSWDELEDRDRAARQARRRRR